MSFQTVHRAQFVDIPRGHMYERDGVGALSKIVALAKHEHGVYARVMKNVRNLFQPYLFVGPWVQQNSQCPTGGPNTSAPQEQDVHSGYLCEQKAQNLRGLTSYET